MLVNRKIAERMAKYADLKEADIVLEVGCGTGNLTAILLRSSRVIGIEKDLRMIENLKERFKNEISTGRFHLIHADALDIDFPVFNKFVSNIPYEISSPLIFKLFRYKFDLAVIMLQKEFAERLCKEDSRLGVISKAYCTCRILEVVGRENFRPVPRVDSAIVLIEPKPKITVKNRDLFEKFVTFAFSMKRKRLQTIVREFKKVCGIELNLDTTLAFRRPEEIGASGFMRIVDDIRTGRGQ